MTVQAREPGLAVQGVEVQRRFATPFLVVELGDTRALNDALRSAILARAASDPGVQRSNDGGWQSAADFADWSGEAGRALLDTVLAVADSATALQTDAGLLPGGPAWKVNAWANVNRAGAGNRAHHHPAAFWSGIYWVDAGAGPDGQPAGGELEIHDPRGVLPAFYAPGLRYALPGCLSAGGEDFFTPRSGALALFPAWLTHAVRPYRGVGARISVAINLSV